MTDPVTPSLPSAAPSFPSAAAEIRYPRPQPFNGVRDGFSALTWLKTMERYFCATQLRSDLYTVMAVAYLGPRSAEWFNGSGISHDASFEDFKKAFKNAFIPDDFLRVVRHSLATLRMTSTVEDYTTESRRLLSVLTSEAKDVSARYEIESMAHISFIEGCPKSLQQLLSAMLVTQALTVEQLYQAAEKYDRIYHFQSDVAPLSSATAAPTPRLTQPAVVATNLAAANPMAMEIDNLRVELNYLKTQLYQRTNRSPLSRGEREDLTRRRGCFKCRQEGHFARDCPERGAPRGGGRRLNLVSVNHDPNPADNHAESGKETSGQL